MLHFIAKWYFWQVYFPNISVYLIKKTLENCKRLQVGGQLKRANKHYLKTNLHFLKHKISPFNNFFCINFDIWHETRTVYEINTYELSWKQSKNIWGNCLPIFIIWVSYQREEGAGENKPVVVTIKGHLIIWWIVENAYLYTFFE